MAATSNPFARKVDWKAVLKTNEISPQVQKHLSNVYATLTLGIATAAMSAALSLYTGFFGQWTGLAGLGMLVWLMMTPRDDPKRLPLFLGFTALEGLCVAPLIGAVMMIDPSIIATAFLMTTSVFACFSGAALFAKRRSFLYLGGILSSALSWLLFLSLMNSFFHVGAFASINLYVGLLVFSGYVVFDTQLMIEKASQGSADVIDDAVGLFLDFVNIFIRIMVILAKMSKKKE
jgi:Bax inhibitor 1